VILVGKLRIKQVSGGMAISSANDKASKETAKTANVPNLGFQYSVFVFLSREMAESL
jgi:hypothetical protein